MLSDEDLPIVLKQFRKQHPEMVEHIRALTALQGHPAAPAATALLPFLLQVFDEKEQALWQLRDLVKEVPKLHGGSYYALKYRAGEEVERIVAAAGLDATKTLGAPSNPEE